VDVYTGRHSVRARDRHQLLFADEVADRPDALNRRPQMLVRLDAAAWPKSAAKLLGKRRLEPTLDREEGRRNR
jgi:hypothetical protein